jgi:hypothetical protein
MLTERDLFFSTHPKIYLQPYSRDQIEAAFPLFHSTESSKDAYINELIDNIYTKYNYISLITWDPVTKFAFLDYKTGDIISVDKLNEDFDKYSPMALQKLQCQLKIALNRWDSLPFQQLCQRIENLIQTIAGANYIIV